MAEGWNQRLSKVSEFYEYTESMLYSHLVCNALLMLLRYDLFYNAISNSLGSSWLLSPRGSHSFLQTSTVILYYSLMHLPSPPGCKFLKPRILLLFISVCSPLPFKEAV